MRKGWAGKVIWLILETLCVSLLVSTVLSWSLGSVPANAVKGHVDILVTEHRKTNTCLRHKERSDKIISVDLVPSITHLPSLQNIILELDF